MIFFPSIIMIWVNYQEVKIMRRFSRKFTIYVLISILDVLVKSEKVT
jgi:hypothetical protein